MKRILFFLLIIFLFFGCSENFTFCPKYSFNNSFPKRSINFSRQLDDTLRLVQLPLSDTGANDTITIVLDFDKQTRTNYMVDISSKDTVFKGRVSHYKGLYILSEEKSDSSWWIGALEIDKDTLLGIYDLMSQMCMLDEYLDSLPTCSLIETRDTVNSIYKLNADKKQINKVYSELLPKLPKFIMLNSDITTEDIDWLKSTDENIVENPASKTDDEIIESIFPNPASDFMQIDLNKTGTFKLDIINSEGKILDSKTIDKSTELSLSDYNPGYYFLNIYSDELQTKETHKFVKK